MTSTITIKTIDGTLSEDLKATIKREAKTRGMSTRDWLDEAIEAYIDALFSCLTKNVIIASSTN